MAASKYDNIWALLSKYDFELENSSAFRDLTCIICKKILNRARQSCCGCRYCFKCIDAHLGGGQRKCPGSMEDCREQLLSIANVQSDYVADMKISRLPVRCPEPSCKYIDELRQIENHINSHSVKCPFFEIGCDKPNVCNANIGDHLRSEELTHSTLLMETIQNMKNEMSSLKEESVKKDAIINALQLQINSSKVTAQQHSLDIAALNGGEKEKSVIENLQKELKSISNELNKLKDAAQKKDNKINSLVQKVDKLTKDLTKSPTNELQIPNKLNEKIDDTMNSLPRKVDKPKKELIKPSNEKNKVTTLEKGFCVKTEDQKTNPNASFGEQCMPFQWTIENFSEKRTNAKEFVNSFLLSEPFYTSQKGYKLCLTVYPDGCVSSKNAWLCVGFHIMQGEYDDCLPWPLLLNVTIGIVDQKSGDIHTAETFNYETYSDVNKHKFFKPTSSMNKSIGRTTFFHLKNLLNFGKIFKNDSIIIKCLVENPSDMKATKFILPQIRLAEFEL